MLLAFPVLLGAAIMQTLSLENAREVQISALQVESQYLYVLDLLQESIAITESSSLTDESKCLSLEYVNNCFLAHFQPFIESSRSQCKKEDGDIAEDAILRRFMNAKIFVKYEKSKEKKKFLKRQFDEVEENLQQHEGPWSMDKE